jgi:molybdopterin-guanine dinucleotide biosynthesis protein
MHHHAVVQMGGGCILYLHHHHHHHNSNEGDREEDDSGKKRGRGSAAAASSSSSTASLFLLQPAEVLKAMCDCIIASSAYGDEAVRKSICSIVLQRIVSMTNVVSREDQRLVDAYYYCR